MTLLVNYVWAISGATIEYTDVSMNLALFNVCLYHVKCVYSENVAFLKLLDPLGHGSWWMNSYSGM